MMYKDTPYTVEPGNKGHPRDCKKTALNSQVVFFLRSIFM